MNPSIEKILYSEEELKAVVSRLAEQINSDYRDKNLLLVGILKGAVVFMTDLMRAIDIPCGIDFMAISSYGASTKSTGVVRIVKDLSIGIDDYDVLIVEDILDSGRTLSYLMELLSARHPRSLRICVLLDKPDRRAVDLTPDYTGLCIPDEFVVGYGLDFDEQFRNLPYIGVLKDDIHKA